MKCYEIPKKYNFGIYFTTSNSKLFYAYPQIKLLSESYLRQQVFVHSSSNYCGQLTQVVLYYSNNFLADGHPNPPQVNFYTRQSI